MPDDPAQAEGPWTKYQSDAAGPWTKYQAIEQPTATAQQPPPAQPGLGERALNVVRGAVDVVGTTALNIPIGMVNAASNLVTGRETPLKSPVQLEKPGQELMQPVQQGIRRAGAAVAPYLDPEVREAGKFWSQPQAERTKQLTEAGHPTLARAYEVGEDIAVLSPLDRKSTRLNSSHEFVSRMPSSA